VRRGVKVLAGVVVAAWLAAAPAAQAFDVTIRRTAHGIPHVYARDYASLAYGYAYAFAQDNLCQIADSYATVDAQRSRFFGADNSWRFEGNGTTVNNLNSDFFYQRINDTKVVENLVAQPPPAGPKREIKEGVRGYVAGYNAYLQETGADKLPDPTCRGKPWVRPIDEMDVYRRFYQLASLASQGVALDGIAAAAPLTGGAPATSAAQLAPAFAQLGDLGSNAYGLGKEATDNGRGMVLGNPHFPWQGSERFYQAQLTIPGELDVAGASLFGVPLINIGTTRGMAWSHTVSTARRFTPFEEKLVPGSPTSYLYDGQVQQMKADKVTVKLPGGERTRTLYSTRHGPVFTSLLGLPLFPWTASSAYAMGDANAGNFRYLNHFLDVNRAQSVRELDAIERHYEGIPWVNTIAADSAGKAYYADIGAVPNVSNAKASACNTALGAQTLSLIGVPILDGSRAACEWDNDPDAAGPGIFGPSHLPSLFRDDYVTNSNDSYWLSNPQRPLEGFARIIGDERTARSLRTRLGLKMAAGRKFSLKALTDTVFNDRQYGGELLAGELAAYCRANPTLSGSSGPVDVSAACPVLERWGRTDTLDDPGAVLFRRWATRALASVGGVIANPTVFSVPFDPADPVNTPRGLNTGNPQVGQALADAVKDLRDAGIPLDSKLREYQFEARGGEKIPIHGGPGTLGVFNAIANSWNGKGFPDVNHGSSYVQAVQLTGGCPNARTILTYSQSVNPRSPYFADQTRMYSRREWNPMRFCAKEILTDPALAVTRFGCPGASAFRSARASGVGRSLRLRLRSRLGLASTVELARLRRGRRARPVLRVRRARSFVRRLAAGRYRVRVLGRAESGMVDRREATVTVAAGRVTVSRGGLKRRGACRR
jgi:acyl-homoserine-lactone acylase